jgi:hypothetical protein
MNNCINCLSDDIVKHGTSKYGIQRYLCMECGKTFTGNQKGRRKVIIRKRYRLVITIDGVRVESAWITNGRLVGRIADQLVKDLSIRATVTIEEIEK